MTSQSPQIIKENLFSSINYRQNTPKITKNLDLFDEKPQPYVSLTNGKIEDPITLPSFEEFLGAKGDEFMPRKGKDELFYRINKATEKIDGLNEKLNQQISPFGFEEKKFLERRAFSIGNKRKTLKIITKNKKNDLRSMMNQYYTMPSYYNSPKPPKRPGSRLSNESPTVLSTEAENSLEDTLKLFYRTKAIEHKKLSDILYKVSLDRPLSMQRKVQLIQNDKEMYKNKLHSIEKFNSFRGIIENFKRKRQYKNHKQGLVYLEILDEYKRKKYEPNEAEFYILEYWKKMIEAGFIFSKKDLSEMVSSIPTNEKSKKETFLLIEKLNAIC